MIKTDVKDLFQLEPGVIVNHDGDSLSAYLAKREAAKKNVDKIKQLEGQINSMSNDISQIKSMLLELLRNNK